MTRIFSHPYGGVLSAYGMGLADQIDIRQQTGEQILEPGLLPALESNRRQLEATAAPGLGERRGQDDAVRRSEGRRVGEECVSTCQTRWWPDSSKKKNKK